MSDTIQVPNYQYKYRSTWASDLNSAADQLHQAMYLRQILDEATWEESDETQVVFGEAYATNGGAWPNFITIGDPATCTVEIRGAKMPITLIVTDDLAAETEYEMGNSNASQTLTPPTDRTYSSARIIRRF